MSVITIWQRYNKEKEEYEHNHISNGFYDDQLVPAHTSEFQRKSWANAKWKKSKADLINGKVSTSTEDN